MMRVVVGLAIYVSGAAYGQSAVVQRFEVASVKPVSADQLNGNSGGHTSRGRLRMTNVTLKRCIMGAYGIGPNQISGGPEWLDSDHYEIVAKAEQPVGDDILMAMLQTLLAERFKLVIHHETKAAPALALEVAKNGPKLEKGEGGESTTHSGRGRIDAKEITMDRFAEVLSRQMDLPVVNRTGLDGAFNLKLEWTLETSKSAAMEGPSIFTSIQQQLGLRLRSQKTPIEILVIDHAEKPSEN